MDNLTFVPEKRTNEDLLKMWEKMKPAEDEIKVEYKKDDAMIQSSFRLSDSIKCFNDTWSNVTLPRTPTIFLPDTLIRDNDTPNVSPVSSSLHTNECTFCSNR